MAGKAAQDASSDAKDTVNGPNEAAFNDEILAPEAVCLSTPRRNTHCRMRPSRGVQPITSQTFALSVVVEASSDPQSVLTRATNLTMSESPSSAKDSLPCPRSRKRVLEEDEEESEGIAKKARNYDGAPVSQGLRPRRSTGSSTDKASYFMNNFDSVQLECDTLQGDIDELDLQLRKEVRSLRRRFREETREAEHQFKTRQQRLCEEILTKVRGVEEKIQSDREALQKQLDSFKEILKEGGLIDLDA